MLIITLDYHRLNPPLVWGSHAVYSSVEESEEGSLAEFVPQFAAPSNSNFTLVGGRSDPTKWDFRQFPTQVCFLLIDLETRLPWNPVYRFDMLLELKSIFNKIQK